MTLQGTCSWRTASRSATMPRTGKSATEQPSLGGGQELYLYDGEGQRVEK